MTKMVAEHGPYPGCGFHLFIQPHDPLTDSELLATMNLGAIVPLDDPDSLLARGMFVLSIAHVGSWIQIADDYGLWNSGQRRRDAVVERLARLGDLFSFQLPDCDMSYAFALYRGGVRVRLRDVDSPAFTDQILQLEKGESLVGEPASWRGEPLPMMISIARGLGVDVDIATTERFYGWGSRTLHAR